MLQLTEHGVTITLNGKSPIDKLFWIACVLVVLAIGVALAMIFLPMKIAISFLVLLVIVSFVFNRYKQRMTGSKSAILIANGVLSVQQGIISYNHMGKQQRIIVLTHDKVENLGSELVVYDKQQTVKCRVSGFENNKEIEVMSSILQGKNINKRHANIKMQSS
ncbi:MAG: hypothetical protein KGV51_02320 [Moraxellaceae bacterium]|nr:hypothetical protein [Moraxellaceae bacterium]